MKISNLKQIKIIGCVMAVLSLLSLIGLSVIENLIWKFVCLIFFVAMVFIIISLRSIEIETSGECFSFKEKHPFFEMKYVPSKIELPLSLVDEFDIQEGILLNHVNIKIRSDHAVKKIGFSLPLFTKHQILNMRRLLEEKIHEN